MDIKLILNNTEIDLGEINVDYSYSEETKDYITLQDPGEDALKDKLFSKILEAINKSAKDSYDLQYFLYRNILKENI